MKPFITCMLILLTSACAHHADEKHRQQFANDIIRALGTDGEACTTAAGKTYCVSANRELPRPIAVGDTLEPGQELWLCQQQVSGSLVGCQPIAEASIHCLGEPGAGGGCRCTGIEHCLKMAQNKDCKSGSCGDCLGADCCCKF